MFKLISYDKIEPQTTLDLGNPRSPLNQHDLNLLCHLCPVTPVKGYFLKKKSDFVFKSVSKFVPTRLVPTNFKTVPPGLSTLRVGFLFHLDFHFRDYVRGGKLGALAPRNLGVQKREQKEKQTIY